MACVNVNVEAPPPALKPVITNVSANTIDNVGTIRLTWNQNIAGTVDILIDGEVIGERQGIAGTQSVDIPNQAYGSHSVCVSAV